jgi:hypothetical protein
MVTHAKVAECSLSLGKVPPLEVMTYNSRMTSVDAGYHLTLWIL